MVWLDEGCVAVAGDVCRDEAPLDAELAPDCLTLEGFVTRRQRQYQAHDGLLVAFHYICKCTKFFFILYS